MSQAFPGGLVSLRKKLVFDSVIDMIRLARFLYLAGKRAEIAEDLFDKALPAFRVLYSSRPPEVLINAKTKYLSNPLDRGIEIGASAVEDTNTSYFNDFLTALRDWEKEWQFNKGDERFSIFAAGVLVQECETKNGLEGALFPRRIIAGLPGPKVSSEQSLRRDQFREWWDQAVGGLLATAMAYQLYPTSCHTSRGDLPSYYGLGRKMYTSHCREAAKKKLHLSNAHRLVRTDEIEAGLKRVKKNAEKYCDCVDAILEKEGYTKVRPHNNFQRDLEWLVARHIEGVTWQQLQEQSGEKLPTIKKAVSRMLDDLSLPRGVAFTGEAPKRTGRKRK